MSAVWSAVWPEWQMKNVIGRGAYGVVYRACRMAGGVLQEAAIKVIQIPVDDLETDCLRAEGMTEEETRNYYASMANDLYQEIRTMQQMDGEVSIVNVQDSAVVAREDTIGWNILIRMECLTPFQEYQAGREMSEEQVIALGIDLARALETCEKKHILHRDIKPENIFVDREGHFKLGDFGVARQLESTTGAYTRVGTPFYAAPEVANGSRYDRRSDIYSLGLVMYRLLNANRLPFMPDKRLLTPGDRRTALEKRLKGEALPQTAAGSPQLQQIVLKACAPKAKDRYENAAQFREALESLRSKTPIPWWKKGAVWAALLALVLLGGLAAAAGLSAGREGFAPVWRLAVFGPAAQQPGGPADGPVAGFPAQSTGAETLPDKTAPGTPEETSWQTIPGQTEPQTPETMSAGTDPSQIPPPDMTAPQTSPAEIVPPRTEPPETIPPQTEPPEKVPPQTEPPETVPSQTAPPETVPAPTEPAPTLPAIHLHSGPVTVIREPSCETEGEQSLLCDICGKTVLSAIPAAGHRYSQPITVTSASCTQDGLIVRVCAFCSDTVTETVSAFGHQFSEWTAVREASCTEDGERRQVCSVCGESLSETIAAAGHHYSEWTAIREASCTQDGERRKVCSACGEFLSETIAADGHHYSEWTVVREAGCTQDGERRKVCSACGDTVTEILPAAGHSYGEWYLVQMPLCTLEGTREQVCKVCGEARRETLPRAEHQWTEWEVTDPAGCIGDYGLKERHCVQCGERQSLEIPFEMHVFEFVVTQEPTCTERGIREYRCSRCGLVMYPEPIPELGHEESGNYCARCGDQKLYFAERDDGGLALIGMNPSFFIGPGQVNLTVPSHIDGKPVTTVAPQAFPDIYVHEVFFPDTLTTLEPWCIDSGMGGIGILHIPASVKTMENLMDSGSGTRIGIIIFEEGFKTLPEKIFFWNGGPEKLILPDSLEYLSPDSMYLYSVGELCLGANVRLGAYQPGGGVWHGARSFVRLHNITLSPENPYYTLNDGFLIEKETGRLVLSAIFLRTCTIPAGAGIRVIGTQSICEVNQYRIEIPDGVTEIESEAISGDFYDIVLPASIRTLGDGFASSYRELTIIYRGTMEEWSRVSTGNLGGWTVRCLDGTLQIEALPDEP